MGGSTDFPVYYHKYGGSVLSTTVDKYCWLSVRWLPPFFEHKHHLVWSRIETPNEIDEIVHPSIRACLKFLNIKDGIDITHTGDLPARSGIGSSSAFTVGLLNALYALQGKMVSKSKLAGDAIFVEQEIIREAVGSQDQTASAFGGLNRIDFHRDGTISVIPVTISKKRYVELENHLMFFFSGISRTSSEIVGEQIKLIPKRLEELSRMRGMVDEAVGILNDDGVSLDRFGELLHESWMEKRKLSSRITNEKLDGILEKARSLGAIGEKVTGAGGGGFILLFAKPKCQKRIRENLGLLHVPFRFERFGSQIIYYEP